MVRATVRGHVNRALLATAAVAVLAAVLIAVSAWLRYQAFLETPLEVPEGGIVVEVPRGDTMSSVIARLAELGATKDDWRWRVLLRLEPATIQAGEYEISPQTTPRGLLDRLERGEVIQYRFTIVEGWSFRQLVAALQSEPRLAVPPERLDAATVMESLGSAQTHPEGWFLPETYAYVRGDDALAILSRAHDAMRQALDEAWADRSPDLPLETPYELLILASIVEKESARIDEYGRIAGVFARRLRQGWRLETDPTVIYGLGEEFDGDIRTRDLRTDNPYNTYTRHGLPPTPISMPGPGALGASARPASETAMFFVADGEGGHVFSDTLQQHNAAVRKMLKRTREGARRTP